MSTRRNFLKLAACGVMPAIVPATVFGRTAPSEKMTIGFIGTGNNGTGNLKPFLEDERVKVVAVCDVNREGPGYWGGSIRGREPARRLVDEFYQAKVCDGYEDYRELLARRDLDAVYIGTPDHWHALNVIDAAAAGKHIFGQKPLSLTVAEGRAMADAVKKAGVVWQTGSQQRSDQNFRRVCELALNGRLGKIHTVRVGLPGGTPDFGKVAHLTDTVPVPAGFVYDFWLGPAREAPYCPARVGVNFRWNFDYSGGQVTDWGAHHLDIAQWGLGYDTSGPVAVRNARGKFAKHPVYNTATEFYFECEYANGVKMIVSNEERFGVTFEGEDGWAWSTRRRHETSSLDIFESQIAPSEINLYRSDDHTKNFIDSVFTGAKTVAPIEVAHRSITVAHLANIALIKGRDIRWNPDTEQILDDPGASEMLRRDYRQPWKLS